MLLIQSRLPEIWLFKTEMVIARSCGSKKVFLYCLFERVEKIGGPKVFKVTFVDCLSHFRNHGIGN